MRLVASLTSLALLSTGCLSRRASTITMGVGALTMVGGRLYASTIEDPPERDHTWGGLSESESTLLLFGALGLFVIGVGGVNYIAAVLEEPAPPAAPTVHPSASGVSPEVASRRNSLDRMAARAFAAARAGDCVSANAVSRDIAALDQTYYQANVAGDTAIAACVAR